MLRTHDSHLQLTPPPLRNLPLHNLQTLTLHTFHQPSQHPLHSLLPNLLHHNPLFRPPSACILRKINRPVLSIWSECVRIYVIPLVIRACRRRRGCAGPWLTAVDEGEYFSAVCVCDGCEGVVGRVVCGVAVEECEQVDGVVGAGHACWDGCWECCCAGGCGGGGLGDERVRLVEGIGVELRSRLRSISQSVDDGVVGLVEDLVADEGEGSRLAGGEADATVACGCGGVVEVGCCEGLCGLFRR